MNLEKLDFVELTEQEKREISGGNVKPPTRPNPIDIQITIFETIWNNKHTKFVKNLFAGSDPYYP